MRRITITLVMVMLFISIAAQNNCQSDLYVRYAKLCGYEIVVDNIDGNLLVRLPNNELVSLVEFYQGAAGTDYNYC